LREREVLQLIAEGKTTKEIAHALGVTAKTAEVYRSRLKTKLDVDDTAGLVRYAIRLGIVHLGPAGAARCRRWCSGYPCALAIANHEHESRLVEPTSPLPGSPSGTVPTCAFPC
jgi:DNA-binding CsgD family transcriptional regulator